MALFWPVLLEQIMAMLMSVLSTMMIAGVSEAAVAGVGMVGSVNMLIMNTFIAVSTGITVIVTQYIGAKRHGDAARASAHSIVLTLYISIAVGALMILFDRTMLQFLFGSADADVLSATREYMLYSSISLPFLALHSTIAGVMRASGNMRQPMFASLFGNIAHLVVAYPLIYVFRLGIAGAGWGLLAFRVIPALLLSLLLRRGVSGVRLPRLSPRLDRNVLKPVLRIALPAGFDNIIFHGGRLIIQVMLAGMGTAILAANTMLNTLSSVFELPGNAFLIVIVTIAGQNFGAGNYRMARRDMLLYTLYASIATTIPCLIALPFREQFFLMLGASEQTIAAGVPTLILYVASLPLFWCAAFVPHAALRATDSANYTMWVSIISMVAVRMILSWFFGIYLDWKLFGIWLAMVIDWGVRGALYFPRMIGLCKRQERLRLTQ